MYKNNNQEQKESKNIPVPKNYKNHQACEITNYLSKGRVRGYQEDSPTIGHLS